MLAQNTHSSNVEDSQAFHPLQPCPYCGKLVRILAHRITGKIELVDATHTPLWPGPHQHHARHLGRSNHRRKTHTRRVATRTA